MNCKFYVCLIISVFLIVFEIYEQIYVFKYIDIIYICAYLVINENIYLICMNFDQFFWFGRRYCEIYGIKVGLYKQWKEFRIYFEFWISYILCDFE